MIYALEGHELDVPAMELRRGGRVVRVEPQVFDVLAYLVQNRDRLVSRHELLDAVWGHRFVTEATLSSRIMATRRAVGDSGREQRVIRTVRGRGFRLVAEVRELDAGATAGAAEPPTDGEVLPWPAAASTAADRPAPLGRPSELGHLRRLAADSLDGTRQLIVISGEAGIGKTTLASALLEDPVIPGDAVILRCQCMERHGSSEPYMAVLDGLASACGAPGGGALAAELAWRAPSWIAQMPWLLRLEDVADVPEPLGITPERMLREIVEALEAISLERPVVMLLEDAHWSGAATLDVLAMLAGRDTPGRLLLVATARPGARQEAGFRAVHGGLRAQGRSVELVVTPLAERSIAEYLVERLGEPAAGLAQTLAARSGGNPLFMRQILEWWLESGVVPAPGEAWREPDPAALGAGIPDTLRDLVEEQVARLSDADRAVVEAAAVAGPEASAAAVAAAAGIAGEEAEARLDRLGRAGRMVVELGGEVWPDGTVAGRYGFVHELLREVIESGLAPGRRARAHRLVASRLATAFRTDTAPRSAEIASHLLAAGATVEAVPHLRAAAERALARAAPRDALSLLEPGLAAVAELPPSESRDACELALQAPRGIALLALRGWGAPEPLAALERARELAERDADPDDVVPVLYLLASMREYRSEYAESQAVLHDRLALPGPELRAESLELLACSCFHQGRFATSVEQANAGLVEGEGAHPSPLLAALGEDARVGCHTWAARARWFLGYPDAALAEAEEALALTRAHPYGLASAKAQMALLRQQRGEPEEALAAAESARAAAAEGGYAYVGAVAEIVCGWARAMREPDGDGIEEIENGIAAHAATGARMDRPHFLGLLAEAQIARGRTQEAEPILREALSAGRDGRPFFYDPELRRLLSMVLRERGQEAAADRELAAASELARAQGARSLELRIAADAAMANGSPGALAELRALLDWFEEGEATPDQVRACALLAATG